MAVTAEQRLITNLETLVGNLYVLYARAHGAHWNVEGKNFQELHAYFGGFYDNVHDSIDNFAEAMRQHKVYAPATLEESMKLANLKATTGLSVEDMLKDLAKLNADLMENLHTTMKAAEAVDDCGLSNYCQDRLAWHLKQDWQLRAMRK